MKKSLPKVTVTGTFNVFLEENVDKLLGCSTAFLNVLRISLRVSLQLFFLVLRIGSAGWHRRSQVSSVLTWVWGTSCTGTLAWRRVAPTGTCTQILV